MKIGQMEKVPFGSENLGKLQGILCEGLAISKKEQQIILFCNEGHVHFIGQDYRSVCTPVRKICASLSNLYLYNYPP